MNNLNRPNKSNQQYGLSPAHFAIWLAGFLFSCTAIGTTIIGIAGYSAEGFRLCSFWTIAFGAFTWLLVWLAPDDKTVNE